MTIEERMKRCEEQEVLKATRRTSQGQENANKFLSICSTSDLLTPPQVKTNGYRGTIDGRARSSDREWLRRRRRHDGWRRPSRRVIGMP